MYMSNLDELNAYLTKIRITIYVSVFLVASSFLLQMTGTLGYSFFITEVFPCILMIVIVLSFVIISNLKKKFRKLYKEMFVNEVFMTTFENAIYDPDAGFPIDEMKESKLMKVGNMYHSEDYISAKHNGVAFEYSDVVSKHKTGSGKNSHIYTYFKGNVYKFRFDKGLEANFNTLYLDVKNSENSKDYSGIAKFLGLKEQDNLKKVNMESVEFDSIFNVKSTDEHFAFYVLTPAIMETLLGLRRKYPMFRLVVFKNHLYFGIEREYDSFDNNSMKPIVYFEEKQKIDREIDQLKDVIELFESFDFVTGE